MVRILICAGNKESAEIIYKRASAILKKARVQSELSFSTSALLIVNNAHAGKIIRDVYILDAASRDCLELADYVRKKSIQPSILFFNVQRDWELNGIIKYRPSYLVFSPEKTNAFEEGLLGCCAEQRSIKPYFTVKSKDSNIRVEYKDIMFFESTQRIVRMYTLSNVVEFYAKLGDVADMLPNDRFVRCHQSYLLNLDYVRKLDKSARYFYLISGKEIPVSKSCYNESVQSFELFASNARTFA